MSRGRAGAAHDGATPAVAARRRLRAGWRSALLRDAVLAGAGAVAARLFLFALGVVVSRSVGAPALFGVFSSVLLAVQLVATFAGLGLAQTAAQAIAAAAGDRERQDRTVRSVLVLVVAAGLLSATAMLLAVRAGGLDDLLPPAARGLGATAALLVAAQLVTGGLEGVLRGLRLFRALCAGGVAASIVAALVTVPLVGGAGVRGGLLAAASFLALQSLFFAWPLASRLRGGVLPVAALGRLLGVIAAPTLLNGFAWNLAMLLPPLLLARERSGLEQLALWNAAAQIRTVVSFVPIVVANAALPRLAAAFAALGAPRREVASSLALASSAAVLGFVPVLVAAGPLMAAYGQIYGEHAALLRLVASFVLLQVLGSALFVVLLAAGRAWETALVNVTWSAAILVLAPSILERGGAYGLAGLYLWSYLPVVAVLGTLVLRALVPVRRARCAPAATPFRAPEPVARPAPGMAER